MTPCPYEERCPGGRHAHMRKGARENAEAAAIHMRKGAHEDAPAKKARLVSRLNSPAMRLIPRHIPRCAPSCEPRFYECAQAGSRTRRH